MGYTTSTVHGIEVPDSSETNNIPEDIGKVVTALEAGSLAKRLTGAAIAALTAPQKPAGLLVYNTTTNKLQISDGTSFVDVGVVSDAAWPTFTTTWTQQATIAKTGEAAYMQVGKLVVVRFALSAASAGTAGQAIKLTLPVTAKAHGAGGGAFWYFDAGTAHYTGFIHLDTTSTCAFYRSGDTNMFGSVAGPTVANTDIFTGLFAYEAA